MKDFDRISFSKDVAETLGIEVAIILELYQQNKITYSGDSELFKTLVKRELPFIDHAVIEASLKKLLNYKLISNAQKITNEKNYNVKTAQAKKRDAKVAERAKRRKARTQKGKSFFSGLRQRANRRRNQRLGR